MGEMLPSTLVLEDSLCLNGSYWLCVQSAFLTPVSFVPCFSAQPCQQLWGDSAGQEQLGDSHRELLKPALLTEECLVNQALSVLKVCMVIPSSWGGWKFFPLLKTKEMLLLFSYSSLTESFGLLLAALMKAESCTIKIVLFPFLFSLVLSNTFVNWQIQYLFPTIDFYAKLSLKGNLVQHSGRLGKWPWQSQSSTRMMRGMFSDPFLELFVCLHQLAGFQGKLWTVVLLEQVKVEPFATA